MNHNWLLPLQISYVQVLLSFSTLAFTSYLKYLGMNLKFTTLF